MPQRRLRLGDILDDYCPRERRVTNHAVVAKIDDDVKLTRCLTCDTDHDDKQGTAPTLRTKKDNVAAAYQEVLAGVVKGAGAPAAPAQDAPARGPEAETPPLPLAAGPEPEPRGALPEPEPELEPEPEPEPNVSGAAPEAADGDRQGELEDGATDATNGNGPAEGPVHRRLIRAQLPRSENQPVVRPIPQFTMRQPTGRAAKFRPSSGRGPRAAGARAGATQGASRTFPSRTAAHGSRPGRTEGQRARSGQPPRHGKKHSK